MFSIWVNMWVRNDLWLCLKGRIETLVYFYDFSNFLHMFVEILNGRMEQIPFRYFRFSQSFQMIKNFTKTFQNFFVFTFKSSRFSISLTPDIFSFFFLQFMFCLLLISFEQDSSAFSEPQTLCFRTAMSASLHFTNTLNHWWVESEKAIFIFFIITDYYSFSSAAFESAAIPFGKIPIEHNFLSISIFSHSFSLRWT